MKIPAQGLGARRPSGTHDDAEDSHACNDGDGSVTFLAPTRFALDAAEATRTLQRTTRLVLALTGLIVLAIMIATWRFARSTTAPLAELVGAAEAIARGEYGQRVTPRSADEIGQLAVTFNAMGERIATAHRELEQKIDALDTEVAQRVAAETELRQALTEIKTLAGAIQSRDLSGVHGSPPGDSPGR